MNELSGKLAIKGERGYSAYELAVKNGYEGTEQEWIEHFGLDLTDYVQTSDVVDDLTSTYVTRPLSANQGKNLKDDMDTLSDLVNVIGDKYEYTLTKVESTIETLNWYDLATNETTDTIPKGRYLILYKGEIQGTSSTTNICTIQPLLDGSGSVAYRTSIPTNNYGSSFQVWRIGEFLTDATHTLNVQGWSNSQFSVSRDIVVTMFRLK